MVLRSVTIEDRTCLGWIRISYRSFFVASFSPTGLKLNQALRPIFCNLFLSCTVAFTLFCFSLFPLQSQCVYFVSLQGFVSIRTGSSVIGRSRACRDGIKTVFIVSRMVKVTRLLDHCGGQCENRMESWEKRALWLSVLSRRAER